MLPCSLGLQAVGPQRGSGPSRVGGVGVGRRRKAVPGDSELLSHALGSFAPKKQHHYKVIQNLLVSLLKSAVLLLSEPQVR